MPTVSVVIPVYNQAQYLTSAIQSVLAQTYRDFEIIVVDDGSTDDTPYVAQQSGDAIRYIRQENQGQAAARNAGIRQAQGEYIALLDSDDQWLPTYLETMLSLAAQHPDAAAYYCCARCIDATGHELPQLAGAQLVPSAAMYQTLLRANFLIPSTMIIRQSAMITAGLFDQSQAIVGCEDWDLWLRLAQEQTFVGTATCLVHYRLHGNSCSANLIKMQQAATAVINKHVGPDDGQWQTWPEEKRVAYSGVYRYYAITSILRQNDWVACTQYLRQAFQIDPTLATDLDLFYELALGTQPLGYRGTLENLNLEDNAANINRVLTDVFRSPVISELASIRRLAYGTAYYALGLVAYNTGQASLSRRYLFPALRFRPGLWRDARVVSTLIKSFVPRSVLGRIKNYGIQTGN